MLARWDTVFLSYESIGVRGYRVYFIRRGTQVIVILGGGTKSTQDQDIRDAQTLAQDL
jgi:putative addiction module killer protein